MCDYSLHHVASRPAKVGDKIVSTNFIGTITRGFAAEGEPNVAVCLLPGTEIGFDKPVEYYDLPGLPTVKSAETAATFCQVEKDKPHTHHDALQFADGKIVLLTHLVEQQYATVLQMPVDAEKAKSEEAPGPGTGTVTETSPSDLVAA